MNILELHVDISYPLLNIFCKLHLLQQLLFLVSKSVVLVSTGALKQKNQFNR